MGNLFTWSSFARVVHGVVISAISPSLISQRFGADIRSSMRLVRRSYAKGERRWALGKVIETTAYFPPKNTANRSLVATVTRECPFISSQREEAFVHPCQSMLDISHHPTELVTSHIFLCNGWTAVGACLFPSSLWTMILVKLYRSLLFWLVGLTVA